MMQKRLWCSLVFCLLMGALTQCSADTHRGTEKVATVQQAVGSSGSNAIVVIRSNRDGRYIVVNNGILSWALGTNEATTGAQFAQEHVTGGFLLRELASNKYIKLDAADRLVASAPSNSNATLFRIEACGAKVAITADKNGDGNPTNDTGRYVKANNDVEAKNSGCDPHSGTSWEKWELIQLSASQVPSECVHPVLGFEDVLRWEASAGTTLPMCQRQLRQLSLES